VVGGEGKVKMGDLSVHKGRSMYVYVEREVWETLTSTMLGTASGGSVPDIYVRNKRIRTID
jgi:hypothetical protein